MTNFKSEIAAKAEEALDKLDGNNSGTATGEDEKADPAKPEDDSAAADEGVTSDELDEGEEDKDELPAEDEKEETAEDSEKEDPADDPDSDPADDDEIADVAEKPMTRSQKRIQQLINKNKDKEDEIAVLKAQLQTKAGTPAEKDAADKKLLDKGYTPEQIAEGRKFLETMGYIAPEQVSEMQKQLQKISTDKLIAEDRDELRTALKQSKSTLTEQDVMKYVKKWGTSTDPKIAARASLDYRSIIKLISNRTVVEKVVDATIKAKKKVAPKIPAGGGGSIPKAEEKKFQWNPADRRGSIERLQEMATSQISEEA